LALTPPQSSAEAMEQQASQSLTISLGAASKSQLFSAEAGQLVALADSALYRAKALGRNRLCQAEPSSLS
jgi:PleD family two-component response regulator